MKYTGIGAGGLLLLIVGTVIILPPITNVQRYLPEIEEKLSADVGRPVTIGSDLMLSFFPTPIISFSNLQIGNPDGYLSDVFIRIASFEMRFALLPLLKRKLAISRFIVSGLEVTLEKRVDGAVNWDFSRKQFIEGYRADSVTSIVGWSLPRGLTIDLLVVTDGVVNWLDSGRQARRTFADLMLMAHDFNLDDPFKMEFKASIAGKSLALEGKVGPLGPMPGNGLWPDDLAARFIDTFSGRITGKIIQMQDGTGSDFVLRIPPSSTRDFLSSIFAEVQTPAAALDRAKVESVGGNVLETAEKEQSGTGKVRINPLEIKETRP
jgi:hypothetical protein